jgi:hypothetical protein
MEHTWVEGGGSGHGQLLLASSTLLMMNFQNHILASIPPHHTYGSSHLTINEDDRIYHTTKLAKCTALAKKNAKLTSINARQQIFVMHSRQCCKDYKEKRKYKMAYRIAVANTFD